MISSTVPPLVVARSCFVLECHSIDLGPVGVAVVVAYLVVGVVLSAARRRGLWRDVTGGTGLAVPDVSRGRIFIPATEAATYRQVASLLRAHARGGATIAGPDAPEIYFLADLRNPTPMIYDFLTRTPVRDRDILAAVAQDHITAIVVNHSPPFSPQYDPSLLSRLEEDCTRRDRGAVRRPVAIMIAEFTRNSLVYRLWQSPLRRAEVRTGRTRAEHSSATNVLTAPSAPPLPSEVVTAVLFTCAGQRVDIVTAFREAGATTVAVDVDQLAPALYHADRRALVPRVDDFGYVAALRDLVDLHDIRLIVPLTDLDHHVLADAREQLRAERSCSSRVSRPSRAAPTNTSPTSSSWSRGSARRPPGCRRRCPVSSRFPSS